MRLGQVEQAIKRMEDAYALVGDDEPDDDLVRLVLSLGEGHYFAGNRDRTAELIERGLDLAEALELPDRQVDGWFTKGQLIAARRPAEARGLLQLTFDTALANEYYTQASATCATLSDLCFQRDRYSESLDHLEQAITLSRRIGTRPVEWFALSEMTYALAMLGRWDEALTRFAELPDERIGKDSSLLSPAQGILEVYIQRGQLDQARQMLSRYEELGRSGDAQVQSCYQTAVAAVRFAEGDHRAALAAAEHAFAAREHFGTAAQGPKAGLLHAVEAARALDDQAKLNELLETVEALPVGLRPPLLDATSHRFRAHLAGSDPGADRHFTTAESQLRALELPFHLAVVQLEHGEWLTARERPDDARQLLAEARETFDRLRALPWLARIDAIRASSPAETLA